MKKKKIRKLLDLCEEMYREVQEEEGHEIPPPFVKLRYGGQLLIYSSWNKNTEKLNQLLIDNNHLFK